MINRKLRKEQFRFISSCTTELTLELVRDFNALIAHLERFHAAECATECSDASLIWISFHLTLINFILTTSDNAKLYHNLNSVKTGKNPSRVSEKENFPSKAPHALWSRAMNHSTK